VAAIFVLGPRILSSRLNWLAPSRQPSLGDLASKHSSVSPDFSNHDPYYNNANAAYGNYDNADVEKADPPFPSSRRSSQVGGNLRFPAPVHSVHNTLKAPPFLPNRYIDESTHLTLALHHAIIQSAGSHGSWGNLHPRPATLTRTATEDYKDSRMSVASTNKPLPRRQGLPASPAIHLLQHETHARRASEQIRAGLAPGAMHKRSQSDSTSQRTGSSTVFMTASSFSPTQLYTYSDVGSNVDDARAPSRVSSIRSDSDAHGLRRGFGVQPPTPHDSSPFSDAFSTEIRPLSQASARSEPGITPNNTHIRGIHRDIHRLQAELELGRDLPSRPSSRASVRSYASSDSESNAAFEIVTRPALRRSAP
jgi:hypothetical protein